MRYRFPSFLNLVLVSSISQKLVSTVAVPTAFDEGVSEWVGD